MLPWWGKIVAKVVLSRIPIPYRKLAQLGMFRHGKMDDARYANGVFMHHFRERRGAGPWVGVEIGPGDSVFSAVLARAHGASRYWLIDSGEYAERYFPHYLKMADVLVRDGLPQFSGLRAQASNVDELLRLCAARYLTKGVDSLFAVPDNSVDLVWSHAVLEHIRVSRFAEFCAQMYRILRPGGIASHQVDFKDHLSAGLNNLRFSREFWEHDWFAPKSGFYTNRIRPGEMKSEFDRAGFQMVEMREERWKQSPIKRSDVAAEFRRLDESEFLISGVHYVLRKPDASKPSSC